MDDFNVFVGLLFGGILLVVGLVTSNFLDLVGSVFVALISFTDLGVRRNSK